jgi:hypothetical protein
MDMVGDRVGRGAAKEEAYNNRSLSPNLDYDNMPVVFVLIYDESQIIVVWYISVSFI